ncbi:hypothetical protein GCM10010435_36180 [Winogradskya consettensis]|uniref:FAD dependent oxidoreductase domain-containing protein n=1 Tax=Winogradskya consettensis TaxID=113560 RepID=A0A919VY17_9ACTN|nr:FAD-dependent oxidoreductase [Actinoplanes consettensis]GIM81735.1 hypothetical protein Aco04nite_78070 [Actinoplanes consettensis]
MRIAIVGAGLAGTLLAWRLHQLSPGLTVTVHTLPSAGGDATAASGGLVRGFEPDGLSAEVAAESLAELYADPALRETAGYTEIGSVYVLEPGAEIADPLKVVDDRLPGSATVLDRFALHRLGLRGLPPGTVGVQESRAGYLSPARLRDGVLARLTTPVLRTPVTAVGPDAALTLADGRHLRYDAVVLAAGAWTPRLLNGSGGPNGSGEGALRTRRIQYTICLSGLPRIGSFVDETSGLYGRPLSPEIMLLGVPTTGWDVDPDRVGVDTTVIAVLRETVRQRFGEAVTPVRSVAAADCYTEPAGLLLRAAGQGLFTFTGGSGGAAKAVLAASRRAAAALLDAVGD